jgi:hypothetical protein
MLLLVAYRPVVSTVMTTNDDGSGSEETTTILRRGREMYCEEGLAALSAATRMAPGNIQYQLDYAQGLQACDQVQFSVNLLTAL